MARFRHAVSALRHALPRQQHQTLWMLDKERVYGIECGLTLCSLWASWALMHPPSNFGAYQGSFLFVAWVSPNETFWGLFALTAAMLKIFGLWFSHTWVGLDLRMMGIGASGAFWTLFGLSTIGGNPDSLSAFLMLWMGFTAWWLIRRLPSVSGPL